MYNYLFGIVELTFTFGLSNISVTAGYDKPHVMLCSRVHLFPFFDRIRFCILFKSVRSVFQQIKSTLEFDPSPLWTTITLPILKIQTTF